MAFHVFCDIASFIQSDGKLIDDQKKLVAMTRFSRRTIQRAIKELLGIGEIQTVPSKGKGYAIEYRTLLGEIESDLMYAHFRGEIDLNRVSERHPNNEQEQILGCQTDALGCQTDAAWVSDRRRLGVTETPPRTTRTIKTKRTANSFLEKELKAKGAPLLFTEWTATIAGIPLKDKDPIFKDLEIYGYDYDDVMREWNKFTRAVMYTDVRQTDWLPIFRRQILAMAKDKPNGH
jgi:hypothetical protein